MNPIRHLVLNLNSIDWPDGVAVPTKRFRLLLVGDRLADEAARVRSLGREAYTKGMVYCCCWGEGCEKTHDLVDEGFFKLEEGFSSSRIVLTTWHNKKPLTDTVEYFAQTLPAEELQTDSQFWIALCFQKSREAQWIDEYLRSCEWIYGSS